MSRKLAKSRIQEELERLAMFERRSEKVAKLNGGHKRRVEIARALLHKPSILLLDEPTVGLDVQSRVAIVEYIHYLTAHEQLAVLWASHLLDEIYSTDQVLVMHKGKIKAKGHREQIVAMTQTKDINTAFAQLTQGELS
jgi:ABC-2 type transport system ATP-binding protein